jgi:hypothetical protein
VTAWKLNKNVCDNNVHALTRPELASGKTGEDFHAKRKRNRKDGRARHPKKRKRVDIDIEGHGITNSTVQLSDVSQMQPHSEPASMQDPPAAQGVLLHTRPRGCARARGSSPLRHSEPIGPDTQGLHVPAQRHAKEQQLQVCTQHGQDAAGTAPGNEEASGQDNSSNCEGTADTQDSKDMPCNATCPTREMYSAFELVSPPSSNQDLSSPTVITMHLEGHRYFCNSESCLESFGGPLGVTLGVCLPLAVLRYACRMPCSMPVAHEHLGLNSERYLQAKQEDCGDQDCVSTPSAASAKVAVEGTAMVGGGGEPERSTGQASGGERRQIQFVAREGETPAAIIQQVCVRA